jgi:hypothetical protein
MTGDKRGVRPHASRAVPARLQRTSGPLCSASQRSGAAPSRTATAGASQANGSTRVLSSAAQRGHPPRPMLSQPPAVPVSVRADHDRLRGPTHPSGCRGRGARSHRDPSPSRSPARASRARALPPHALVGHENANEISGGLARPRANMKRGRPRQERTGSRLSAAFDRVDWAPARQYKSERNSPRAPAARAHLCLRDPLIRTLASAFGSCRSLALEAGECARATGCTCRRSPSASARPHCPSRSASG